MDDAEEFKDTFPQLYRAIVGPPGRSANGETMARVWDDCQRRRCQ